MEKLLGWVGLMVVEKITLLAPHHGDILDVGCSFFFMEITGSAL
jgi:hypothetical protein